MLHKAWSSIEEVPYCFARSSIKFHGHTGGKIDNLNQFEITRPVAAIKSLRFALLNSARHWAWLLFGWNLDHYHFIIIIIDYHFIIFISYHIPFFIYKHTVKRTDQWAAWSSLYRYFCSESWRKLAHGHVTSYKRCRWFPQGLGMGLLPDAQNCGFCMRPECLERFPRYDGLAIPTSITHVPWRMPRSLTSCILWSRWRGKRSWHSRRMRNAQFYVSGKRSIITLPSWSKQASLLSCVYNITNSRLMGLMHCTHAIAHHACLVYYNPVSKNSGFVIFTKLLFRFLILAPCTLIMICDPGGHYWDYFPSALLFIQVSATHLQIMLYI